MTAARVHSADIASGALGVNYKAQAVQAVFNQPKCKADQKQAHRNENRGTEDVPREQDGVLPMAGSLVRPLNAFHCSEFEECCQARASSNGDRRPRFAVLLSVSVRNGSIAALTANAP
ncbi:hypothetical protein PPUJ20005_21540 [Pseudomonas putida]|nr:hypothetical protein PPUJ20005_21540 [Pseudomonas putida]